MTRVKNTLPTSYSLKYVAENQASSGCSDTDVLSGSSSSCASSCAVASCPKLPAKVHEISDSSDDEVIHQRMHAFPPKRSSSGVSCSTAVKTTSTDSDSLKRTAFMDIGNVVNGQSDEASVSGQTSPLIVDNWDVSDDDLPTLPRLPDLGIGSPSIRKARHSLVEKPVKEDVSGVGSAATVATITEMRSVSDSDGDDAGQIASPQPVRNVWKDQFKFRALEHELLGI